MRLAPTEVELRKTNSDVTPTVAKALSDKSKRRFVYQSSTPQNMSAHFNGIFASSASVAIYCRVNTCAPGGHRWSYVIFPHATKIMKFSFQRF